METVNWFLLAVATGFIPFGVGVVWKSKRIGMKMRDALGNADENRMHREDNLPENAYVKNIDAVIAGLGFMVFMFGLALVVVGTGAVKLREIF
jgi:hypothetical protein